MTIPSDGHDPAMVRRLLLAIGELTRGCRKVDIGHAAMLVVAHCLAEALGGRAGVKRAVRDAGAEIERVALEVRRRAKEAGAADAQ